MTEGLRKEGACGHCGKAWQPANYGSPRKCAFSTGVFNGNNWQCGLVSPIRSAFEDEPHGFRFRSDEIGSFGALVVAVPYPPGTPDEMSFGADHSLSGLLVGEWYKDRGATDDLHWAFRTQSTAEGPALTLDEAKAIRTWLGDEE